MPHDARAISNFFLECATYEDFALTSMTLLKILYFAHAWHLVKYDEPLVAQPFEAWKYGPVNRVVYDQIKKFGSNPIQGKLEYFDPIDCKFSEVRAIFKDCEKKFLLDIYRYYSRHHAYTLSDLSHEKGGPWEKVWSEASRRAVPGMFISNDMIKEWFKKKSMGEALT